MINPATAWWIILVIFIVNGVLLLNQFLDKKDNMSIAVGAVFYTFIFYCFYILKGAL